MTSRNSKSRTHNYQITPRPKFGSKPNSEGPSSLPSMSPISSGSIASNMKSSLKSVSYADIAKIEKEPLLATPPSLEKQVLQKNKKEQKKEFPIPPQILKQNARNEKYKYVYRTTSDGNITDNCTLYAHTNLAYQSNIEEILNKAVAKAKTMPEIFGEDFECEFKVNLVKTHNTYIGYAFIHLTNPALYYVLLGYTADGKDNSKYIDDPDWIEIPKMTGSGSFGSLSSLSSGSITKSTNWADMCEEDEIQGVPKIRIPQEPLIKLESYEYDTEQREFDKNGNTHGTISITPGYITPGIEEKLDPTCLYVSDVPALDYDLLYDIFAVYSKKKMVDKYFYPKIKIHKFTNDTCNKYYAIVKYENSNDAGFALTMTKKIRLLYRDEAITLSTKYAFRQN